MKKVIIIGATGSLAHYVIKELKRLENVQLTLSNLEYTILRPDWFTNTNEVDYVITKKGEPEKGTAVSRKSIAVFVAKIVDSPEECKAQNLCICKPIKSLKN